MSEARDVMDWADGAPNMPWSAEWFIAETTYGDRVVLRALPEGYSYDFTTADASYIKSDKIKRWMQFPDSEYKSTTEAEIETISAAALELANAADGVGVRFFDTDTMEPEVERMQQATLALRAALSRASGE